MDKPFSYYISLDGPHLDGLIGHAGLLRFDWPSKKVSIEYYDGVSGGHNISIAPSGKLGLLGNFSQQIVLVDLENLRELGRQSTLGIESTNYRLRANTHHLWYDDNQRFIGAVGDYLYLFDVNDLGRPQQLGLHRLFNAHELRWDSTKRYILMGDLGPEREAAKRVGVFDLQTKESTVIHLPDTCWHVCVHPERPLGYAATYSFATEDENYVDWSPAFRREYVFEIDLEKKRVRRSWSGGAEFPIHLNSDIGVYGNKLYIGCGGSHTVVELDLDEQQFREPRILDCKPNLWQRTKMWRQKIYNIIGASARRPTLISTHFVLQTLLATGWRVMDGIYATRVSPDGKYLVTGNRGYNVLTVYDRQTFRKVYSTQLPTFGPGVFRRPYSRYMKHVFGMHLGMHHSEMLSR
ncbi:MAG: hypothetical protein ACRD1X_20295 [Vicinamibacteria bacterium]